MENLKKQYRDLKQRVLFELRKKVENSSSVSKIVNEKCIKVSCGKFKELTIINDRLTFIDENNLHFSVLELPLSELIDILI